MANKERHNNGPHNDLIDEFREITHEDDGSDIGADDWANPEPAHDDDVPVFDRGHADISPDSLFDDPDKYTWG